MEKKENINKNIKLALIEKYKIKFKIYIAYFKIRFLNEIQYKTAAIAGVLTQFAWGMMYIMLYEAFLKNGTSADYTIAQMCTYIWLHQAFLRLFNLWSSNLDSDILEECQTGNISMELIRPVNLYLMWHAKTLGKKIAMVTLRALPIFVVCGLPFLGQYKMMLPTNFTAFVLFIITLILSAVLLMAYTMVMYGCIMKTISSNGIRMVFNLVMEFCSGALLPLAFMPNSIVSILKFTPFYYMENAAFNIYNGYISNMSEILLIIVVQLSWILTFTIIGKTIMNKQLSNIVVQGG